MQEGQKGRGERRTHAKDEYDEDGQKEEGWRKAERAGVRLVESNTPKI